MAGATPQDPLAPIPTDQVGIEDLVGEFGRVQLVIQSGVQDVTGVIGEEYRFTYGQIMGSANTNQGALVNGLISSNGGLVTRQSTDAIRMAGGGGAFPILDLFNPAWGAFSAGRSMDVEVVMRVDDLDVSTCLSCKVDGIEATIGLGDQVTHSALNYDRIGPGPGATDSGIGVLRYVLAEFSDGTIQRWLIDEGDGTETFTETAPLQTIEIGEDPFNVWGRDWDWSPSTGWPPTWGVIPDQDDNVNEAIVPFDTAAFLLAEGSPAPTFAASGLPTGLNIDTATGIVTGTPTVEEVANVIEDATNAKGTDQATFDWTISPAGPDIFAGLVSQADVNTRGRTDDAPFDHVLLAVATLNGGDAVGSAGDGGFFPMLYTGATPGERILPSIPDFDIFNGDFTLAQRATPTSATGNYGGFEAGDGTGSNLIQAAGKDIFSASQRYEVTSPTESSGTYTNAGNPTAAEHVFVMVREGNQIRQWYDGVEISGSPRAFNATDFAVTRIMWSRDTLQGNWDRYQGNIWWTAVYDRALSLSEVQLLDDLPNPFV